MLRAINLGNHNKVNMPALRAALAKNGFSDVRTYVQSGNLVANSKHRSEGRVIVAVHDVVADEFGIDVPVIARTPRQWQHVIDANPFGDRSVQEPTLTAVSFMTEKPDPAAVDALQDGDWGGDEIVVTGREAYISYAKNVHGSKLTPALLARRLDSEGTARNWRTVLAIRDLIS